MGGVAVDGSGTYMGTCRLLGALDVFGSQSKLELLPGTQSGR